MCCAAACVLAKISDPVAICAMQVVSSGQEAAQLKSLQDKVQLDCCMAPVSSACFPLG